jgi:hypothetical protein
MLVAGFMVLPITQQDIVYSVLKRSCEKESQIFYSVVQWQSGIQMKNCICFLFLFIASPIIFSACSQDQMHAAVR